MSRHLPEHLRGDGPCMDCATLDTPVWFAPNVLWNCVVGGEGALDDPGGLLCPSCFIRRTDEAGLHVVAWELTPQWHWETHAEHEARLALDASPRTAREPALAKLLASFGESPHVYDPETQRCTCGALDHPDWGVTA